MTIADKIFFSVFAVLVFVVPSIVVWATYSPRLRFDLSTLWVHQRRIDKFAVIILGTWWVHTSSMILWTLTRTVTTADYATYMGWAVPIIAKMFAPKNGGQNDTTATP
jgi:hypothetical protein